MPSLSVDCIVIVVPLRHQMEGDNSNSNGIRHNLAITIQSKERLGMGWLHNYVANQGVGRWPDAGVLKKLSLAGLAYLIRLSSNSSELPPQL
jgi:hypothetical protein